MPKPKRKGLTEREEKFCQEHLIDLSYGKAALRAGFSPGHAYNYATELMRKPDVRQRIEELKMQRQKRTNITQDKVVEKLWAIADLDPKELYDDQGSPLPLAQVKKTVRKAISGLKVNKIMAEGRVVGETIEVKFADRLKALELLGRHLGMFKDKVEHSGSVGLAERLQKALKK